MANPQTGWPSAYIYLVGILLGVNLLQIDLSSLAGVTEVTIRNRCKDILTSFKLNGKSQTADRKDQGLRFILLVVYIILFRSTVLTLALRDCSRTVSVSDK